MSVWYCSTFPEGVSRRTFGPSVQAWVGLLSGAYRLSKRNIVALLSDAFGVHLCPGTVSQLEQEVSAAVAEPVEAARAYVRQQPTVNLDETGWRECRLRAWLWVVITAGVSVFAIRRSRGREVVDELLGDDSTAIVGSLPDVSSEQMLGALRTLEPNVKVAVCTDESLTESKSREEFKDLVGILKRPLRTDRLLAVLRKGLEG